MHQDLVASRHISTVALLFPVLRLHQPGGSAGLAERQQLLQGLTSPPSVTSFADLSNGLGGSVVVVALEFRRRMLLSCCMELISWRRSLLLVEACVEDHVKSCGEDEPKGSTISALCDGKAGSKDPNISICVSGVALLAATLKKCFVAGASVEPHLSCPTSEPSLEELAVLRIS